MTYSFPQRAKFRIANSNGKRKSNVHLFSHRKLMSVAIKYLHQSCNYTLVTLSSQHILSKYLMLKKKFETFICRFFTYM